MSFTEQEHQTFIIAVSICAGLSLISSLIVISMYLIFQELKTFAYRLVTYLSISDLMVSIVLITPKTPEAWCIIKACLFVSGCSGRVIITYIIAKSVYTSYFSEDYQVEKYEKQFVFTGIAVLLVLIALPFTTSSYGDANNTCWINATGDNYIAGNIWRATVFYLPCLIITILVIRMYVKIIQAVREKVEQEDITQSMADYTLVLMNKLRLFPMFNLAVVIPALMNRIYDLVWPDNPSIELVMIATLPLSLLGVANAILFIRTPSVRGIISRILFNKKYQESLLIKSTTTA
jgi:hypothetical protein